MSHNVKSCILAALYGKDKVKIGDLLPYIKRRIDPSKAVRAFYRRLRPNARKNTTVPLQEQIRIGTMSLINDHFRNLRSNGEIEYTRTRTGVVEDGNWDRLEEIELIVTEKGKKAQKRKVVWMEMARAAEQGLLEVKVEVKK